jgi:hypothetical protein
MACYVMLLSSKDPRDRGHGPGAWPTEWSADMGESRPEPPAADPAGQAGLSPLQKAWRDYQRHTAHCSSCRSSGVRCDEAGRLWRRHRYLCDVAYAALAAERDRA